MKQFVVLLTLLFVNLSHAKDFGVAGHTWPIIEQDMLTYIKGKLTQLQKDGTIDAKNQELKQKTIAYVHKPYPVGGIGHTHKTRSWLYDPTLTVKKNIYDGDGRVFIKRGTTVNPLRHIPMTRTLVFIDGEQKNHVDYALSLSGDVKIILVNGHPVKLMKQIKSPVFFDQKGSLTGRFAIKNVPATVKQEGLFLRITEVATF